MATIISAAIRWRAVRSSKIVFMSFSLKIPPVGVESSTGGNSHQRGFGHPPSSCLTSNSAFRGGEGSRAEGRLVEYQDTPLKFLCKTFSRFLENFFGVS
ncbi:MAG: hypothetical protein IPK83_24095 [Planctomycetes bacterium]|nr:hypothetical protein [Planctomycetota bacterium]